MFCHSALSSATSNRGRGGSSIDRRIPNLERTEQLGKPPIPSPGGLLSFLGKLCRLGTLRNIHADG